MMDGQKKTDKQKSPVSLNADTQNEPTLHTEVVSKLNRSKPQQNALSAVAKRLYFAVIKYRNSINKLFIPVEEDTLGSMGYQRDFESKEVWGTKDPKLGFVSLFYVLKNWKKQPTNTNKPKESISETKTPPTTPNSPKQQSIEKENHRDEGVSCRTFCVGAKKEFTSLIKIENEADSYCSLNGLDFEHMDCVDVVVPSLLDSYFSGQEYGFSVDCGEDVLHEFDDYYDNVNIMKTYFYKAKNSVDWYNLQKQKKKQKHSFEENEFDQYVEHQIIDPAILSVFEPNKEHSSLPLFLKQKPPGYIFAALQFIRKSTKPTPTISQEDGVMSQRIPKHEQLTPGENDDSYSQILLATEDQYVLIKTLYHSIFQLLSKLQEHDQSEYACAYRILDRIEFLLNNRTMLFGPLAATLIPYLNSILIKLRDSWSIVEGQKESLQAFDRSISLGYNTSRINTPNVAGIQGTMDESKKLLNQLSKTTD